MLLFLISCSTYSKKANSNSLESFDARLSSFQYPFETKVFSLSTQEKQLEMVYMDESLPDAIPSRVAVLLHGKNFAGYYWQRIADDLMKKGYRVIMVDQIGFGKSSKPKGYQYSFPQLALNTDKLISKLGVTNYILVGHSMGGMLGVTMAQMFPEKIKKLFF